MSERCPHCASSIDREYPNRCRGCHLTWRTPTSSAVRVAAGPTEPVRWSSKLLANLFAFGLLALVSTLWLPFTMVTFGSLVAGAVRSPSQWLGFALSGPLLALVGVGLAALTARALLEVFLPARVIDEGATVRVRVRLGRLLRTDVRFAKADLDAVLLEPWQHGSRQAWILHRSGRAFQVYETISATDDAVAVALVTVLEDARDDYRGARSVRTRRA